MSRIYVANLPYDATVEEITAFFVGFTVASVKIVTDKSTGKSKGFGFVDVDGSVETLIAMFNGKEFGGRTIRVNEAIDKPRVARHMPAPKEGATPTPQAPADEEFAGAWKQPTLASARRR